jgi:hypothetical protein
LYYNGRVATGQFSARLDSGLLERLRRESAREGVAVSQLAERYIEEGVRAAEFPGITFRPGPAGRRAGLVGGPDVWEVVRDLLAARSARRKDPVAWVARTAGLGEEQVRLAAAYYTAYPVEIEARIEADEELRQSLLAGLE